LTAHVLKRQFMAPGGRFMAESDDSWGEMTFFAVNISRAPPLF